jgi:CubicO group peptidase (beta-lactamase class C family)
MEGVDKQNETLATYIPKLAKMPLSFQPGTQWGYDEGLDVVARAIEIVSGMAFNVFVQKRMFDPLGMKDTHWIVPKDKQARMLNIVGGKAVTPTTNYFFGSSGLIGTARDVHPVHQNC